MALYMGNWGYNPIVIMGIINIINNWIRGPPCLDLTWGKTHILDPIYTLPETNCQRP